VNGAVEAAIFLRYQHVVDRGSMDFDQQIIIGKEGKSNMRWPTSIGSYIVGYIDGYRTNEFKVSPNPWRVDFQGMKLWPAF
jgi:hypothetical protein